MNHYSGLRPREKVAESAPETGGPKPGSEEGPPHPTVVPEKDGTERGTQLEDSPLPPRPSRKKKIPDKLSDTSLSDTSKSEAPQIESFSSDAAAGKHREGAPSLSPRKRPREEETPSPLQSPKKRGRTENSNDDTSAKEKREREIGIALKKIPISKHDIDTLGEGRYLNDNVVEFCLNTILLERNPDLYNRVYLFNTFFYKTLTEQGVDGVKRWSAKVDILTYDYIVVPIVENFHWWLAIICNPGKLGSNIGDDRNEIAETDVNMADTTETQTGQSPTTGASVECDRSYDSKIIMLDSLSMSHTEAVNRLGEYIAEFQHKRGKPVIKPPQHLEVEAKNIPQQKNGYDCGVFMLAYFDKFTKGPDQFVTTVLQEDSLEWNMNPTRLREDWRN
ncbi:hypothetical protein C8A05DRAFT_16237, partial [Staphylotrichum tortipilum]